MNRFSTSLLFALVCVLGAAQVVRADEKEDAEAARKKQEDAFLYMFPIRNVAKESIKSWEPKIGVADVWFSAKANRDKMSEVDLVFFETILDKTKIRLTAAKLSKEAADKTYDEAIDYTTEANKLFGEGKYLEASAQYGLAATTFAGAGQQFAEVYDSHFFNPFPDMMAWLEIKMNFYNAK